jgi:molecular chaperone HscB
MTPEITTPVVQICRSCGGGAPVDVHFCPQCTRILTLGRHGDYFSFLGLPRKLRVDAAELEQNFRTLSRQFHPDYFYNAPPGERRASLERTSYLNDAYRTLKQPISRIAYLLELEGMGTVATEREAGARGASAQVPPSLLEEVFALNEELDEVRALRAAGTPESEWRARLERARKPIDAKRDAHENQLEQLSDRWDAALENHASAQERQSILESLRDRMLERNYINNLLAGIERELST